MTEERASHSATLLEDGRVLIAGGFRRGSQPGEQITTSSAELFDPATGRFQVTGSMTFKRAGHTATLLNNGLILVTGGYNEVGLLSSAELYDASTGTFTPIGNMHTRRGSFTATLLLDGRVLLCGGGEEDATASAEIFDPATKRFSLTGAMRTPRYAHTALRLAGGRVLIAGGGSRTSAALSSAEIFDLTTGAFTPTGDMDIPRAKHAAVDGGSGRYLELGGSTAVDWQSGCAAVERFDADSGRFVRVPDMQRGRFKGPHAVAPLPDGTLLIAGGDPSIEILHPATGESAIVASLDKAYYYSTATALGNGSVLLAGGYDDRMRATNKAWLFRP